MSGYNMSKSFSSLLTPIWVIVGLIDLVIAITLSVELYKRFRYEKVMRDDMFIVSGIDLYLHVKMGYDTV